MKHVFKGSRWRVQLQVSDITRYDNPEWRTVTFSVAVLPASAKPGTAFSRGRQVYHGPLLNEAFEAVERYVKGARSEPMPRPWSVYKFMADRGYVFAGDKRAEWEEHARKLGEEHLEETRRKIAAIYQPIGLQEESKHD